MEEPHSRDLGTESNPSLIASKKITLQSYNHKNINSADDEWTQKRTPNAK